MRLAFYGKLDTHPCLTIVSLRRLQNLVKKLEKQPSHVDEYYWIIQDQLEQGIVERVNDAPQGEREC